MGKTHRVIVNGQEFTAGRGEILLDAALMNGIHIPHDCRSGHCGTCSVRVVTGELFGSTDWRDTRACQCRIISDVEVAVEDVPEVTTVTCRVTAVMPMAPDIVLVRVTPDDDVEYLPGQYFQVQFRGFTARCYSPTASLDRSEDRRSIFFHVRRVPGGHVSSALGAAIKNGHRVKLKGPFGSAFLRPNQRNRLVLVASGTGFAPVWSIADAAMRENSQRPLVLVVGARSIESLYMIPALWRLAGCPNTTIIPVIGTPHTKTRGIQTGSPADYLPKLYADDIVYVAGAPRLVEAVRDVAEASGATWYADPFVPSAEGQEGLLSRVMSRLLGDAKRASPPTVPSQPPPRRNDIARETAPPAAALRQPRQNIPRDAMPQDAPRLPRNDITRETAPPAAAPRLPRQDIPRDAVPQDAPRSPRQDVPRDAVPQHAPRRPRQDIPRDAMPQDAPRSPRQDIPRDAVPQHAPRLPRQDTPRDAAPPASRPDAARPLVPHQDAPRQDAPRPVRVDRAPLRMPRS